MISEGKSMILIFFLQIAAGGTATLLLTPVVEKVGGSFYRMMACIYAAAVALAMGMAMMVGRSSLATKLLISPLLSSSAGPLVLWVFGGMFLSVAIITLVQARPMRTWIWGLLAAGGFLALLDVVPLFIPADAYRLVPLFQAASIVTSAVSLGAAISALLLGHWYLVTPALSIGHLQRLVLLMGISLAVQAVLLVGGLLSAAQGADAELVRLMVARPSFDALCFWVRVVVGLFGGIILAAMTWRTLSRYRQTQAATGILYVAAIVILIGEATGRYLLAFRQLPL